MRSDEFLNYIKSKGNREEYENALWCVKTIEEFENEHHVNIDEIIEDDDIASSLFSMPGYSDALFFAMDIYKRAINESPDFTALDEKECTCPDRFIFNGTRNELIAVLCQIMEHADAIKLADNLGKDSYRYRRIIDETEFINIYNRRYLTHGLRPSGTIMGWDVNINLKALSLVMIALILDIKLTIGIASASLVLFGINGQAIVKISAENAEKCLISEAILRKTHCIDGKVFEAARKECVHNNYNCNYREDGMCTITEAQIIATLDYLSQKNVFTKVFTKDGSYYEYNL